MTGLWAGRSMVRILLRERSLQGIYWVAGGVSWRVRLRTRINLVPTLRMCGAIPPLPQHAFVVCIWTMRMGIRESKVKEDRETCQVVELKEVSSIVIMINK